jgi:hypothetical protein
MSVDNQKRSWMTETVNVQVFAFGVAERLGNVCYVALPSDTVGSFLTLS